MTDEQPQCQEKYSYGGSRSFICVKPAGHLGRHTTDPEDRDNYGVKWDNELDDEAHQIARLQAQLAAKEQELADVGDVERIKLALKLCEGIATEPGASMLEGWGDIQPSLRELVRLRPLRLGAVFRMGTLLLAAEKAAVNSEWLNALDIALMHANELQSQLTAAEERARRAEVKADAATAFLEGLRVTCTNDGHKECEGCPGFGIAPNTGAACGAVYQAPRDADPAVNVLAAKAALADELAKNYRTPKPITAVPLLERINLKDWIARYDALQPAKTEGE